MTLNEILFVQDLKDKKQISKRTYNKIVINIFQNSVKECREILREENRTPEDIFSELPDEIPDDIAQKILSAFGVKEELTSRRIGFL